MKALGFLMVLSAAIVCGQDGSNAVANAEDHRSGSDVFVKGADQKWYSVAELQHIAEEHAKEKQIEFDFKHSSPSVWVHTDGSNVIARVVFASHLGKPMYYADIDRGGTVITNFVGVMSEGP